MRPMPVRQSSIGVNNREIIWHFAVSLYSSSSRKRSTLMPSANICSTAMYRGERGPSLYAAASAVAWNVVARVKTSRVANDAGLDYGDLGVVGIVL